MTIPRLQPDPLPLDVIAEVDGEKIFVELDVRNNDKVRIGDRYTVQWPDGAFTILRVVNFKSAEDYSNTVARRIDAMRDGVAGVPQTLTARKAYQTKLAELRIEGELFSDGSRRVGPSRVPDVMLPIQRINDDVLEQFVTSPDGNLILGNLRSGSHVLNRLARITHIYAGERMIIFGMPGKGKSQLVRSLLSQAMAANETEGDESHE